MGFFLLGLGLGWAVVLIIWVEDHGPFILLSTLGLGNGLIGDKKPKDIRLKGLLGEGGK